jgi:23S rRNA (uracil1939-C5)-methyltransferase
MSEAAAVELDIDSLGHRGEGVAKNGTRVTHVAYTLPGERVRARLEGARASLIEILERSPERIAPICGHFGDCGGCATQHISAPLYADWKRRILTRALAQARIETEVGPLIDAHGEGRGRATFHARFRGDDVAVGFMQARAHRIVAIDDCPILAPSLSRALAATRAIAARLAGLDRPLDLSATASLSGLDVDIRGAGELSEALRQGLIEAAVRLDLARLSNHGEVLLERRPPQIQMGSAVVSPPPGAFLQATGEGERRLAAVAMETIHGERVADLFSGVGALALRLAERHSVHAVEINGAALAALSRAARDAPRLRPISVETRDLFARPLTRQELSRFDAVVFDPPRAGAAAQASEIAASGVPCVVAVSCNPATFARDARLLIDGGYRLERAAPIDQFRFSPHLEIVGAFSRAKITKRTRPIFR